MYAIKPGYRHRKVPSYFSDDPREVVFQPDVYEFARKLAIEKGCERIVDVGCGWAGKLADVYAQHPDWRFTGIDFGSNIVQCRADYDWGEWLEVELDASHEIDAEGGIIVCADVIEHLREPEHLLDSIRSSGCAAAVLSTPERDLCNGPDDMGPPINFCHVREWNREEFGRLLVDAGFTVEHLGLTRSNSGGPAEHTILAVVTP